VQAAEDLHALNIVHRDFKPENIRLSRTGHIVISDLRWAHNFGQEFRCLWKNNEMSVGTPGYKPTEMFLLPKHIDAGGDAWPAHDHRVDIWGLGMIFLEMASKLPQVCPSVSSGLGESTMVRFIEPIRLDNRQAQVDKTDSQQTSYGTPTYGAHQTRGYASSGRRAPRSAFPGQYAFRPELESCRRF
jgi:serine/threonine protein kinase